MSLLPTDPEQLAEVATMVGLSYLPDAARKGYDLSGKAGSEFRARVRKNSYGGGITESEDNGEGDTSVNIYDFTDNTVSKSGKTEQDKGGENWIMSRFDDTREDFEAFRERLNDAGYQGDLEDAAEMYEEFREHYEQVRDDSVDFLDYVDNALEELNGVLDGVDGAVDHLEEEQEQTKEAVETGKELLGYADEEEDGDDEE